MERNLKATRIYSLGNYQNLQLTNEINSAVSQTQAILNGASTDLASQLQSVDIVGMDVSQEAVLMYLNLTTMAGQYAQVAIPFPQLDMVLNGNS